MDTTDLQRPAPPWLAQWLAEHDDVSLGLWALRTDAALRDHIVVVVRGRKMRRREGAFDELAAALQFPYYFGENWNALSDCVRDLGWLRADGFVVVVLDAHEALADGDADELGVLLGIFTRAGDEWSQPDEFRPAKPFHALLHATPARAADLQSKLAALALDAPLFTPPPRIA